METGCGSEATSRPLSLAPPVAATTILAVSVPSANDRAIDCATCVPIEESRLPSTRSVAGPPWPTAFEKPAGITNVAATLFWPASLRPAASVASRLTVNRPACSSGASAERLNACAATP